MIVEKFILGLGNCKLSDDIHDTYLNKNSKYHSAYGAMYIDLPATVFDEFKKNYFPKFLIKKYPIKYKTWYIL